MTTTGALAAAAAPSHLLSPTVGAAAAAAAASGAAPPLAVEAMTVRYGRTTAVDRVSLALAEGGVYALLGRNGAGKSSLVRCLLGQQRATAGFARIFGRDVWRHRAALMAEVGVVPEQPDAPPGASARRLARLCRRLYRGWDDDGFEQRLRRFAVPPELPFGRLSKGQQRHVTLALALAGGPRLLILDDPTLGLDAVARRAFFEEIVGELADRGISIFLTSHELPAVERIAERVGILDGGRLLVDEDLERLKHRLRRIRLPRAAAAGSATGEAADAALEALAPLRRETRDWGVEVVVGAYDDRRFERLRAAVAGGAATVSSLTLEEIFTALVGHDPAAAAPADAPAAAPAGRATGGSPWQV
jgi:ABC-type multidrug transport system ATPase subunit